MKLAPVSRPKESVLVALSLALLLTLVPLVAGCRAVQTAVEVPGQTIRAVTKGNQRDKAVDPVEVQQTLLRFTDEFATRMTLGADKLRRGTNELSPAEVLKWKITIGTETCAIASGPNAFANLLDMTISVTLTRMSLEEHWGPKVFGESAGPMLAACRSSEAEIWRLASRVLTPEQQAELRQAIEAWHRQNPLPGSALAARALGFAAQLAEANKSDAAAPGSVFELLRVDPLSGMEPAVREIAQTRLFAERALFVTQKMPMLLRWQTELLSINAVEMPAVQQLVTNSSRIAATVDRFAAVAEKLPGQISIEREEILKALEAQEKTLTPLVSEVRGTLDAGSQMSTSLNTTITTFDALMKRFGVGETNPARARNTNAAPFNILDYAQTAGQLEKTAQQLTELLRAVDETTGSNNLSRISSQLAPAVQQAQNGGKELVDYIFWKGILLVVIGLLAALTYRFLAVQMTAKDSKSDSP